MPQRASLIKIYVGETAPRLVSLARFAALAGTFRVALSSEESGSKTL
jgi:hypothetical protein